MNLYNIYKKWITIYLLLASDAYVRNEHILMGSNFIEMMLLVSFDPIIVQCWLTICGGGPTLDHYREIKLGIAVENQFLQNIIQFPCS